MKRMSWSTALSNILLVVVTGVGVVVLWQLRGLLITLAIAIVLAATVQPLVKGLERYRMPRWAAIALVYLGMLLAIIGFVLLAGPSIVEQIERLFRQLPAVSRSQLDRLEAWMIQLNTAKPDLIDRWFENLSQSFDLGGLLQWAIGNTQTIVERSFGVTTGILGGAFNAILALFFSVYIVAGGQELAVSVTQILPYPWDQKVLELMPGIGRRMGGYLQGRILVSAVLGAAVTAGLSLLGMSDYALGLGAIAGVTNLIPFLGPILGAIPALIVALPQGGLTFTWVLILFVIIQNVETYVLDPLLVGSSVGVRPMYQLLAVLGGVQVMGILGALIVPPWVAGGALLIEELYLKPKQLAEQAADPDADLPYGYAQQSAERSSRTKASRRSPRRPVRRPRRYPYD